MTIGWDGLLTEATPVELYDGHWYKREDQAAPLGYGGINGSKLRQLVHLVERYAGDAPGILTGASVLSPQVSMAALVARQYERECVVVLGATNGRSALRHENVSIAHRAGAEFVFTPVAYNPALQRAVDGLADRPEFAGWYRLHYGITTPGEAADEAVEAFHAVGAAQVANVPDDVTTLVMPAGSCNSCTSVLYGISQHRPASLERIVLVGVGPTRIEWTQARLAAIGRTTSRPVEELFDWQPHHDPEQAGRRPEAPYVVEHYNLHATRFASYQDRMPFRADGIDFHPTYEGKVMTYMDRNRGPFDWWHRRDGKALFWIVGSAPSAAAMEEAL